MRLGIGLAIALLAVGDNAPLERVGRLEAPEIVEASGIVQSRRFPGTFWVHNDSGNPATLFAVKRDGGLIRSYPVAAPNVDWEDIAIDDAGHLYLGDIGNNRARLPLRAIYRVDEPDPSKPADGPLQVGLALHYRFDEPKRFDAEGLFIDAGRATLITKRLDGQAAEVYRLALDRPSPLLRPALPELVGTLAGCVEPATGAGLSPDGRRLAVVTDAAARVYEREGDAAWKLAATVRFDAKDVEAICWDGTDLILASEDRSIYRIAEARWRPSR